MNPIAAGYLLSGSVYFVAGHILYIMGYYINRKFHSDYFKRINKGIASKLMYGTDVGLLLLAAVIFVNYY